MKALYQVMTDFAGRTLIVNVRDKRLALRTINSQADHWEIVHSNTFEQIATAPSLVTGKKRLVKLLKNHPNNWRT